MAPHDASDGAANADDSAPRAKSRPEADSGRSPDVGPPSQEPSRVASRPWRIPPPALPAPPPRSIMATLLPATVYRSILAPLRLAPASAFRVKLELSPAIHEYHRVDQEHLEAIAADGEEASAAAASHPSPYATLHGLHPTTIPSLVQRCASIHGADALFVPSPLLPNGHLQSIFSAANDTVDLEPVFYTRRGILLPDGGIVTLDFCDPSVGEAARARLAELAGRQDAAREGGRGGSGDAAAAARPRGAGEGGEEQRGGGGGSSSWLPGSVEVRDDGRPTLVVLHGLTGGSHESYARHVVKAISSPVEEGGLGWRSVVVNFRGCCNTPVTSPQLYSAAKTSDVRAALLYLRSKLPSSRMVGVGFSLGANVLAKYLGEEGDESLLWAGVVCAAPFDCYDGSNALERSAMGRVYSRAMHRNLSRMAHAHKDTLALHPPLRGVLDTLLAREPRPRAERSREARARRRNVAPNSLKFVDDTVVRVVGGHGAPYGEFPFASADEYYLAAGAANALDGLRRPMLSLAADDDPIASPASSVAAHRVAGLLPPLSQPSPVHSSREGQAAAAAAEDEDEARSGEAGDGAGESRGRGNPYVVLATTQGGGHLGLWESRKQRWLGKPVREFLSAVVDELESSSSGVDDGAAAPPRAAGGRRVVGGAASVKCPARSGSAWDRRDRGGLRRVEVEVELMPAHALPAYELGWTLREKEGSSETSSTTTTAASSASEQELADGAADRGTRTAGRRGAEQKQAASTGPTKAGGRCDGEETSPTSRVTEAPAANAEATGTTAANGGKEDLATAAAAVAAAAAAAAAAPGLQAEAERGGRTPSRGVSRLPWLRTHVLPHAPLVHPSHAVEGWKGRAEGEAPDGGDEQDWEMWKAVMSIDASRPEVGFLELPAWTRVAGIGDLFQGGKHTPGAGLLYGGGGSGGVEDFDAPSSSQRRQGKPGTAQGALPGL